jgi:hypothetical protein
MYGNRGPTGALAGNKIPKGMELGQIQQFSPEQMQLFQKLFSHVGPDSFLSRIAGGDQGAFADTEAPALRQFSGLQGNIASRFSGMGTGARRSSGFQNTMNQASSDFAQDLQSRRQSLQQQALHDLFGMSNQLLSQRPTEQFLSEKKPSFLESLLGGLGNLGGQTAGLGSTMALMKLFGLGGGSGSSNR